MVGVHRQTSAYLRTTKPRTPCDLLLKFVHTHDKMYCFCALHHQISFKPVRLSFAGRQRTNPTPSYQTPTTSSCCRHTHTHQKQPSQPKKHLSSLSPLHQRA
ncbi:unnamed protein product [Ectocarpus sp. 12 AP-2014]